MLVGIFHFILLHDLGHAIAHGFCGLMFDFVYVPTKQFHSTFGKGEIKRACYISGGATIFDADASGREKLFYLFYHRKTTGGEKTEQKTDALSFSGLLSQHFIQIPDRP